MSKQKISIRNFDTIYLKKSVIAKHLNSNSTIFIPKGYYDVIGNNENEFALAINISGDGQKFQPNTKMIYIVDRKDVIKNALIIHTH